MAILTGRKGRVRYDATPASPRTLVEIASLNTFTISMKADYEDVTCFNDSNKVFVPGQRDLSGTLGGFWNSDDKTLLTASTATTPGWLELDPNRDDLSPSNVWGGTAYLDFDINCTLSAPKVTGTFKAAGSWTTP